MGSLVEKRLITADEFLRMAEVGILGEDEHLELIDGEIVKMSPSGKRHGVVVAKLALMFGRSVADYQAFLWVQSTTRLAIDFVPEPDLAVLRPETAETADDISASDVLLIVEAADTSLPFDRKIKLPLYAEAGIPEVWIVNIPQGHIEVYRDVDSEGRRYRLREKVGKHGTVACEAVPNFVVPVGELLKGPMFQ